MSKKFMKQLLNEITVGDAKLLSDQIEDESIDFCLTDPIYQNIEDYLWLAQTAVRVLKPDRALLAFCSDIKMFSIKTLMDSISGLSFVKPFYYVVEAKGSKLSGYGIYTWTTPALLYVKGKGWPKDRTGRHCPDTKIEQIVTTISRQKPKGKHKWNKNPEVLGSWIRAFTEPDEIVFDPFTGSGTVPSVCKMSNRQYLAFEICEDTANLARKRILETQPPLPSLVIEQTGFALGVNNNYSLIGR